MAETRIVGLTGTTGAGKSELAAVLSAAGAVTVDADRIAREVTAPGSAGLAAVKAAYGTAVLHPDGTLDRRALAAIAFADEEHTAALNALLHPLILDTIRARITEEQQRGTPLVIVDAPLLFQTGLEAVCDLTVAVTAPEDRRRARLRERDGLTEAEVNRRMARQPQDGYYAARADLVLCNDGTREEWIARARTLAAQLTGDTVLPRETR